jgi:transposase
MRVIKLTEEEKENLDHLYKTSDNSVVRRRCLSLLLSNDNHSMKTICSITKVGRTTLYYFFNAWQQAEGQEKFNTLSVAKGRGAKVKLSGVEEHLSEMLKEHNRNLNPILALLESRYQIKVCKLTLQNFLKDNGL